MSDQPIDRSSLPIRRPKFAGVAKANRTLGGSNEPKAGLAEAQRGMSG